MLLERRRRKSDYLRYAVAGTAGLVLMLWVGAIGKGILDLHRERLAFDLCAPVPHSEYQGCMAFVIDALRQGIPEDVIAQALGYEMDEPVEERIEL